MAVQIQQRRDTAANWTTNNPTLAIGELGIETDTLKMKVGDGVTAWTSLSYLFLGDMLKATYDPTTVAGDAFDMDNMAQGTTNKFLNATELGRVQTAASTSTDGYLTQTDWDTFNNKHSVIRVLDDLPTPSGGVITLAANTSYFIVASINIGTNTITMSESSVLKGVSPLGSSLVYTGTGTMISADNINSGISDIALVNTGSGTAFDFNDTTKTKSVFINNVLIQSFSSLGTIGGYDSIGLLNWKVISCSDGLTVDGDTAHCSAGALLFDHTVGGSQFSVGGTFETIQLHNCRFEVDTGNIGFEVLPAANVLSGLLQGCFFTSTGTYISGVSQGGDPEWRFFGNKGIDNINKLQEVTDDEMIAIAGPEIGTMAWNTDSNSLVLYSAAGWREVAMTVVKTTLFSEDFESGNFTANGWTVVNDGINDWHVGTAAKESGTYGAYISNDSGTSNQYTINNTEVSHFYKDFAIPGGATNISLSFKWKGVGEVGFDHLKVYNAPTTVTPVAATEVSATYVVTGELNNRTSWQTEGIVIPDAQAGTTRRIIFSWRNDNSVGTQPPAAIDNILIEYE